MYENNHTTKPGKQPKVTSSNAKAIAQSNSATDQQSKRWSSRYVADAIVDIVDDDNVSLTFTTPLRAAHHEGDQFAPDISSAIGPQSMKLFNRYGATRLSFRKKGVLKGEVEEPCDNVKTNGYKFSFRMTGEEMKAAFTYINSKRQHSYTPTFNSATFASHAMKAAGFSVKASNAVSLNTAINKEIDREEANNEKHQWTQYSIVNGTDDDKRAKMGGKQLRAYELGYEANTLPGMKTKVEAFTDKLDTHYDIFDLHSKFTSSAKLNALLGIFMQSKSEENAMVVFRFLFEKRHVGLEIQDVNDCQTAFEHTPFFEKYEWMKQLYKCSGRFDDRIKIHVPLLDFSDRSLGNALRLEAAQNLHEFLVLTKNIFGQDQMHQYISSAVRSTWAESVCKTLTFEKTVKKQDVMKNLSSMINKYLPRFLDDIPHTLIDNASSEEKNNAFKVLRDAFEKEFTKYGIYEDLKKNTAVGKLYDGSLIDITSNNEDSSTHLEDNDKQLANKDESKSENKATLSAYLEKKVYGLIVLLWQKTKGLSMVFKQMTSTTPYIEALFVHVNNIDNELGDFLSKIRNMVSKNLKTYDPGLLRAAGLGDLVPTSEFFGTMFEPGLI